MSVLEKIKKKDKQYRCRIIKEKVNKGIKTKRR